jgi:hypothetical protein
MKALRQNSLPSLVADLKEDEALGLAQEMLDLEQDPLLILEQCQKGLINPLNHQLS